MKEPAPQDRARAASIFVGAIAAALFASPVRHAWLSAEAGWLAPFAVWAFVIALAALAAGRAR